MQWIPEQAAREPSLLLTVSSGAPVQPDGGQARQWALEELGKAIYQDAKPSMMEQLLAAVFEWFGSVLDGLAGVDPNVALVIIFVAAALVIGTTIWLVKPRANPRSSASDEIFDADSAATAAEHRDRARQAELDGHLGVAVVEQFRAIVRSGEERSIIEPQPGRTASEVTRQLCANFPNYPPELTAAGELFNAARYGNLVPRRTDLDTLRELDLRLQRARPHFQPNAEDSLARPL